MLIRQSLIGASLVAVFAVIAVCSLPAASMTKLSDVASTEDLTAEVSALVEELERGLASEDSFPATAGKLRRAAVQLALLSQALSEHDEESKFQQKGAALRDAALQLAQSRSYEESCRSIATLKQAVEGSGSTTAKPEYDWAKIASLRLLMDSLRERTDLVRKALRRPKDPAAESRQASVMAILALAIDAHAKGNPSREEQPDWHQSSGDLQKFLTKTARAIRSGERDAALEHFSAAQQACDRCHEKFKR